MISRSRKGVPVKPVASLVQASPTPAPPLPPPASLLISTQQPAAAAGAAGPAAKPVEPHNFEREMQSLRSGTHPGYLSALDDLDKQQADHVLAIERLREERLRNVEEMYIAEMQALHDQYMDEVEEQREKMIEELQARADKATKSTDMQTRKRAKLSGKDESSRPRKRPTVKGIKATLASDEIASDLEKLRAMLAGTAGGTRSKSKGQ